MSVLAGQKHYCHITAIRADDVVTELLGMEKIPSEDSVRRAFLQVEEAESSAWLTRHLLQSYQPLLNLKTAVNRYGWRDDRVYPVSSLGGRTEKLR